MSEVRLSPEEVEVAERIAGEHGLAFLLDHLGLDGLANEASAARRVAIAASTIFGYIEPEVRSGPSVVRLLEALEEYEKFNPRSERTA